MSCLDLGQGGKIYAKCIKAVHAHINAEDGVQGGSLAAWTLACGTIANVEMDSFGSLRSEVARYFHAIEVTDTSECEALFKESGAFAMLRAFTSSSCDGK